MKLLDGTPPKNTQRVYGWADLPSDERLTKYHVTDSQGRRFEVFAKGKRKRVLEGLRKSPLLAASYCRLSDHIDHLRRDGVDIETSLYRNDSETGRMRYGVYTLHGTVSPVSEREAA